MDRARMPERLEEFIAEEARNSNYELVDILSGGGRGISLEIVIDKKGGITLDECGTFNKKVASWMDAEHIFHSVYTLDVCSPGLDRELRSERALRWARGKQVRVSIQEPLDGKSPIMGELVDADLKKGITVKDDTDNTVFIEESNIFKIRLWTPLGLKSR